MQVTHVIYDYLVATLKRFKKGELRVIVNMFI